jgi:hypothetical protein
MNEEKTSIQNQELISDNMSSYIGTQTPIERLRNKLTPFMNLIELLDTDDIITLPFIDKDPNCEYKNEMFERLLESCILYKDDIKKHLSDCEVFYNKGN